MPLPEFTLHDFNKIASGEYNAGQIDFATGDNGQVKLTKINNHVHKTGLNKTTLSAARILEVKEAFVSALRRGGVSDADIAAIRTRLGIPAEMKATSKLDAQEDILRKRFVPLSRNDVRAILDEYANNGRGFGAGRRANVSWDELHAAHETAHRSRTGSAPKVPLNNELSDLMEVTKINPSFKGLSVEDSEDYLEFIDELSTALECLQDQDARYDWERENHTEYKVSVNGGPTDMAIALKAGHVVFETITDDKRSRIALGYTPEKLKERLEQAQITRGRSRSKPDRGALRPLQRPPTAFSRPCAGL